MAIRLLGHVWGNAVTTAEPRRRGNDVVEAREPSRWNPAASLRDTTVPPQASEAPGAEPVWAETQPWCHD